MGLQKGLQNVEDARARPEINGNFGRKSQFLPREINAPLRGFSLEFCKAAGLKQTRLMALPGGGKKFYDKYNGFDTASALDRQRDGRTDGRTDGQKWSNNIALCMLAHADARQRSSKYER